MNIGQYMKFFSGQIKFAVSKFCCNLFEDAKHSHVPDNEISIIHYDQFFSI